ncbi:Large-conductance mechanosensitive channel [Pigmentiphaga humi]|uniref:Large-conductance mechanosensitive channel n=2 Tax=Pigmentiphaga humi TaxID=2478468 RepID=A0A3P4B794_9BURK|nr:Large-conductance mechanosensitive channel [Pigmentiphaga humi]
MPTPADTLYRTAAYRRNDNVRTAGNERYFRAGHPRERETMSVMKEFREFAMRGSVVDLAVGVIIGGAFGKIVDSMVRDVIMPLVNFILGGSVDFSNKFIVLRAPADYTGPQTYDALSKAGATLLGWGNFVTILINFILLAFVIFWMIKLMNRAKARFEKEAPPPAPAAPPEDVALLREIRDLLKAPPAR